MRIKLDGLPVTLQHCKTLKSKCEGTLEMEFHHLVNAHIHSVHCIYIVYSCTLQNTLVVNVINLYKYIPYIQKTKLFFPAHL